MIEGNATLLVLLIVLTVGLVIPEMLKRFKLPFITIIIIAGSIIGPFGFSYVTLDPTLEFFGFLGMTFLMLMAGLETDMSKLFESKNKIFIMAFFNGFIPFFVGVSITLLFGYSTMTALLIGVIFISSSVAVIVPSLKRDKQSKNKVSTQLMFSSVMITDIISLLALGLIFQNVEQITSLPLILYFAILVFSIGLLFIFIPRMTNYFINHNFAGDGNYENGLRFVLVLIIAILAYFILLGVHPILAAFLAGLALAPVVSRDKSKRIYDKIHTLSYGLFVPVFFFIVGMDMDLSIIGRLDITNALMISLILGLLISKIGSGYFSGRIVKLSKKDSLMFGFISTTQLTTTLAVTYSASAIGLIDSNITTTIILLSIITTFIGPTVFNYLKSYKGKPK